MPIKPLMSYILAVLMLIGVVLLSSGLINALSSTSNLANNGEVVVTYPRVLAGSIMAVFGGILTVFAYLWIHGKIKIGKSSVLMK